MAGVEKTEERLVELTETERTELRDALGRERSSPRVQERLEMVKAADLGHDLETIAAWSGRTPRTVRRWLAAFAAGGLASVADAARPGRAPTRRRGLPAGAGGCAGESTAQAGTRLRRVD